MRFIGLDLYVWGQAVINLAFLEPKDYVTSVYNTLKGHDFTYITPSKLSHSHRKVDICVAFALKLISCIAILVGVSMPVLYSFGVIHTITPVLISTFFTISGFIISSVAQSVLRPPQHAFRIRERQPEAMPVFPIIDLARIPPFAAMEPQLERTFKKRRSGGNERFHLFDRYHALNTRYVNLIAKNHNMPLADLANDHPLKQEYDLFLADYQQFFSLLVHLKILPPLPR
jgi:hypothetical protein